MQISSNSTRILKITCVLATVPAIIFAYEYGPPPRYTAAPGDNSTSCVSSGCHSGTVNSAANGGSVQFVLPNGNTYVPGVTQHIQVLISDANRQSWGFQATARLASDLKNGQAGSFSPSDSSTQVLCDGAGSTPPCSSSSPVQFIEHTQAGWGASVAHSGSYTYAFDWTPPAANAGNVTLYVAGNASSSANTFRPDDRTGHIYTASVTLTPSSGTANTPSISSNGVVNGASFQTNGIAPNTYITIQGTNLATNTRTWTSSDFSGGTQLPTSLDGTSVMVNGKPAYIQYISPTQINAITPPDTGSGSGIPVTVAVNGVTSSVSTVSLQAIAPSFFTFSPGTGDNGKYPAATHANGTLLGKAGLFAASPSATTPAVPGETITLYGTGFGPTTPAIPDGQITDQVYNLSPAPTFTIGSAAATVSFAGLVPPFAKVYQFNVVVPASAASGDQALS
ncbi:MAG: hypothetical protein JWO80_3578, partial [Bryobacterales bacterium]|nr:hypothetical protein [Bryobacterales bacterium]